jgi:S1-C subfamily serine protease
MRKKKLMILFNFILIVLILSNSLIFYDLYTRVENNNNNLNNKISGLQTDTQGKLNEISNTLIKTEGDIKLIYTNIGSIEKEFGSFKAYASADFSDIIEDVVKSVVTIKTDVSQGTGFFITDDGYIVTNAHVLAGGNVVEVITYDRDLMAAEFIGYDSLLDLALLKVSGDYDKLVFADSDDISVGEKVIAIGNPLGLQFSVSEGIISATHRQGANGINAYVQTDAALNPGNSGGPLINTKGKVVGINNFKIGEGENLGFALESNRMNEVINNISFNALNKTLV